MTKEKESWMMIFLSVLWVVISIMLCLIWIIFWWQWLNHKYILQENQNRYEECTDYVEKQLPIPFYCED